MDFISQVIARHGYAVVATAIGLESMGIPMPGETMLISAAIYAGTSHKLSIVLVIVWATIGAIVGDNIGFVVGRRFGYGLLLRHGHRLRITSSRIKLGEFLFARHGGKVVFLGRFVAVLRALAALLAGMNCMPWRRFLFFNASGAIVWAGVYGTAAYWFGREVERFRGPVSWAVIAIASIAAVLLLRFVRQHEFDLTAQAEREMPGPLQPDRRR